MTIITVLFFVVFGIGCIAMAAVIYNLVIFKEVDFTDLWTAAGIFSICAIITLVPDAADVQTEAAYNNGMAAGWSKAIHSAEIASVDEDEGVVTIIFDGEAHKYTYTE